MKMNRSFENFNWGWMEGASLKTCVVDEIVDRRVYEKFFEVEEGDCVVDVGASVGPFAYSILDKNPKEVHCIEPIKSDALVENLGNGPAKVHNFIIGEEDSEDSMRFSTFIKENQIDKIDFLKTDCEGGEYSIFNAENCRWIIKNVSKISGEWHLRTADEKQRFREFRDLYLRVLPHHVYSVDGVNIKWDLWNEHFINYYSEVIIYIDNR